jgi:histidine triad (HIT) family protein
MTDCLFCKFVSKEFETKIVYENEFVLAFNDINPQAPTHILVIPKKHISSLNEQVIDDKIIMGELLFAIKSIAEKLNLETYRTVINTGEDAGQSVFHIHAHIMAGRKFNWPAG